MLTKLTLRPGVNREGTRYSTENGWYETDKVRFRNGLLEVIGGWVAFSLNTYLGVCRSLYQWVTLDSVKRIGVGTNLKFYVETGAEYYDVTPIRSTVSLSGPFAITNGSFSLTVTDTAHGARTGDFVTFSGATSLGGLITAGVLNAEHQITQVLGVDSYRITLSVAANASDTGNGGASVSAAYQINTGPSTQIVTSGWGSGAWGSGAWGGAIDDLDILRLWSQSNFGEDLLFCPRLGGVYFWDASAGLTTRAVNITSLPGASDCPTTVQYLLVSDVSRFVIAFGCNPQGSTELDPLLIRWSDQESVVEWAPSSTNQSGFLRLSIGSLIISALQNRQEILVWTDAALYSMQFLGYPEVWGAQLIADNISLIGPNAVRVASGVSYWMGADKFYKYDGRVATLRCDVRRFVFDDLNRTEAYQVFAGTNERFNEVWWWYCPMGSTQATNYVVYNYAEDIWYYGTMGRTAWIDSALSGYPIAATYSQNLVYHEFGLDDVQDNVITAINAYAVSSEFDIADGQQFSFVWRILPDVSFLNSTAATPRVTMTLYPLKNAGSGYTDPASVAGDYYANVDRIATLPIEQFTGDIKIRVRGRQLALKIESNQVGCAWQLGAPRLDIRSDGRK